MAGDDASREDTQCDAGACPSNTYVQSNACVPCDAGTTNAAGDDVGGSDTQCDAILCSENERVEANACKPCPPWSVNDAGDDASGSDTQCDSLCQQDERVEASTCVPCGAGTTNAAGDDPAGADTQCDDACVAAFGVQCSDIETDYFKASNPAYNDRFGSSIAIYGDTMIVGAPGESSGAVGIQGDQTDNSEASSGAVYVFVKLNGTWSQQAYIKSSNPNRSDFFGSSLAFSGDTLVVGAYGERSNATGVNGNQNNSSSEKSGAVYVFVRANGMWSQQAYLKASNSQEFDEFGRAVALSGDTIVVGAAQEDSSTYGINGTQSDNTLSDSGAAYVFVRNNGAWTQQAYLKASNPGVDDFFGTSVTISSDTVVVGALGESSDATGVNGAQDNDEHFRSGAAYVFVRTNGVWAQQAYLKASNSEVDDRFGSSVALSGDTLVVGAYGESSDATGVNGDQSNNNSAASGAAYVFVRGNDVWTQQAYLKPQYTDTASFFGRAAAIQGDVIVVGAEGEGKSADGINATPTSTSMSRSGAAYVFARTNAGWTHRAYIKAPNNRYDMEFGTSVALSDDTVAIGAPGEASQSTGVNGSQSQGSVRNIGAAYTFGP